MTSLDSLFNDSAVAAQQPNWPGGPTGERLAKAEEKIEKIQDTTYKKEDFREFKEELWTRIDKMEVAFEKRFQAGFKG